MESPPIATEWEAHRAGIPDGYSYNNWRPGERPILLMGAAFHASAFGKYVYDWTAHHYSAPSPVIDIAADFWTLIVRLSSTIKRCLHVLSYLADSDTRDRLYSCLRLAESLWAGVEELVKLCEDAMREAAAHEVYETLKERLGAVLVNELFGRDRLGEDTEKLMGLMRQWNEQNQRDADLDLVLAY